MHKSPPRSYQQLQPEDRQTLATLIQQGYGVRHITRVLVRSPAPRINAKDTAASFSHNRLNHDIVATVSTAQVSATQITHPHYQQRRPWKP